MRQEVAQLWINAFKEAPFIGRLQILYMLFIPVFMVGSVLYLTWLWSTL